MNQSASDPFEACRLEERREERRENSTPGLVKLDAEVFKRRKAR